MSLSQQKQEIKIMVWVVKFIAMLMLVVLPAQAAQAAGDEFSLTASDLIIGVNSKWAGCHEGGYYPIRVSIRNNGKARSITVQLRENSSSQKSPLVSRSFSIEQNATVNSTLLVPMVSTATWTDFRVLVNGRFVPKLSRSVSLPEVSGTSDFGSNMLIVASKPEDKENYNNAVNQLFVASSSYRHGSLEFTEHVRPQNLPTNWLAYSGLDICAISLKTLNQDISADARTAILQWVASGGNLLIYKVGDNIEDSKNLEKVLDWNHRASKGKQWEPLKYKQFQRKMIVNLDDNSTTSPENLAKGESWKLSESKLQTRTLGLGVVIAFSENPFPGTISHWFWLLNQIPPDRILWQKRNGINPRTNSESFYRFLIPNVGGVPVFSLLILITLFTILIGPVNYIYYLKKRKLAMLLFTVPLIAFGSSIVLLTYSTVAHGFSVKSRIRSVTFLDQKQQHKISISRIAYYAGMAPSGGLQFEPTTAIYPIWPITNAFESGRVDWSETQHWQSGWLRSRTRTQFLTISQQEQRGRIELKSQGEAASVSNGLEWELDTLFIADEKGKIWVAKNVKAGATTILKPVTSEHRNELRKYLGKYNLELPSGMNGNQFAPNNYVYSHHSGNNIPTHYRNSIQENLVTKLSTTGTKQTGLKPNSYFSVLKQAPNLDLGLKQSNEKLSMHLLFGYF